MPICEYCKKLIEFDLAEIPVDVKWKEKPKPPIIAHRKCWRLHRLEEDTYILGKYLETLKTPFPIGKYIDNYHEFGSRYADSPKEYGYPHIVIFNALKMGEGKIQWMDDQKIFKDAKHKMNTMLKLLDSDLEIVYADWLSAQQRLEEGE